MEALLIVVLMAAAITMGIGTGVYLLYAFVIMPALAPTDDRTFVGAYQRIDTVIVGPFLLLFFIGPLVFTVLALVFEFGRDGRAALGWIVAALALQLAMVALTMIVHVPLNNGIKAAGDPDRIDDLAAVRARFDEARWVRWNSVRALAAMVAFVCLVWGLVVVARS